MPAVPLRVVTAGESHGPGLTCIVEGIPAGLELDRGAIDRDLARRQLGHGRGGGMKIESDAAQVTAGVRHGRTLGGPIALQVANRDFANWEERMNPWPVEAEVPEVHLPRPVHAPPPARPLAVADFDAVDDDPVRTLDQAASRAMVEHINALRKANESIG